MLQAQNYDFFQTSHTVKNNDKQNWKQNSGNKVTKSLTNEINNEYLYVLRRCN